MAKRIKMATSESKIESISVVLGRDVPPELRKNTSIQDDSYVEVRAERVNPVNTTIIKLDEAPGKKFSRLLME